MKKSIYIAACLIMLTAIGCSTFTGAPEVLAVSVVNETGGQLSELKLWEKSVGTLNQGEEIRMILDVIHVQGKAVMTPYEGKLDDNVLKNLIGWCGTGMKTIENGEYTIVITSDLMDNEEVLWFDLQ